MSMLTLNGLLDNVFSTPASTDKKTGEVRPASVRAQLYAQNQLENGDRRLELVTIKVADYAAYKALEGKQVSIPVGAFVANNSIIYFEQKGERVREA